MRLNSFLCPPSGVGRLKCQFAFAFLTRSDLLKPTEEFSLSATGGDEVFLHSRCVVHLAVSSHHLSKGQVHVCLLETGIQSQDNTFNYNEHTSVGFYFEITKFWSYNGNTHGLGLIGFKTT